MKTLVRYILATVMLGVGGFFTGCMTRTTAQAGRLPAMTFQMKVVESSSDRQLSPEEMKTLHDATIKFLAKQGDSLLGGTYYVRVNFVPAQPGEPGEWVLVEIISEPIDGSTRVAAYRDSSPYYYSAYAQSGYSPYSSDYYYDPYEYSHGGGNYHPAPVIPPQGHRPHDRGGDDKPHDRDGGNRPHDRDRGDHPPGTYAGGNDHDRDHNPRTTDNTPRSHASDPGRDRAHSNREPTTSRVSDNSSSNSGGGSSYTPPPSSSSSEPSSIHSESSSSNSGIQAASSKEQEK